MSHADVASGISTAWEKLANDKADELAKRGTDTHGISRSQADDCQGLELLVKAATSWAAQQDVFRSTWKWDDTFEFPESVKRFATKLSQWESTLLSEGGYRCKHSKRRHCKKWPKRYCNLATVFLLVKLQAIIEGGSIEQVFAACDAVVMRMKEAFFFRKGLKTLASAVV